VHDDTQVTERIPVAVAQSEQVEIAQDFGVGVDRIDGVLGSAEIGGEQVENSEGDNQQERVTTSGA